MNYFVLGLGITGLSTVRFLLDRQFRVFAWDDRKDSLTDKLSTFHSKKNFTVIHPDDCPWNEIDRIVISPGINPERLKYKSLQQYLPRLKIVSDIDLLFEHALDSNFICITGTNGKSTSCDLIHKILSCQYEHAYLGGNIGIAALDLPLRNNAKYILELSSFQLNLSTELKPDIAVLLNITPDHLDQHGTMEKYIEAKKTYLYSL